MRVLLVALAATSALAASAASVSCVPGTYYWGTLKTKHYCVKCPASWTSKGCSNCLPDPKGSMCFKPDSACTRGMFVLPATKSNTDKCEKCAEGRWQPHSGRKLCYACPTGHFQPSTGFYSCYACTSGRFQDKVGATACAKSPKCAKR